MRAVHLLGGGHEIVSDFHGQPLVLVHVRPTGLMEWGDLDAVFAHTWVPELIEALTLAEKIASREKPWEAYKDSDE